MGSGNKASHVHSFYFGFGAPGLKVCDLGFKASGRGFQVSISEFRVWLGSPEHKLRSIRLVLKLGAKISTGSHLRKTRKHKKAQGLCPPAQQNSTPLAALHIR